MDLIVSQCDMVLVNCIPFLNTDFLRPCASLCCHQLLQISNGVILVAFHPHLLSQPIVQHHLNHDSSLPLQYIILCVKVPHRPPSPPLLELQSLLLEEIVDSGCTLMHQQNHKPKVDNSLQGQGKKNQTETTTRDAHSVSWFPISIHMSSNFSYASKNWPIMGKSCRIF